MLSECAIGNSIVDAYLVVGICIVDCDPATWVCMHGCKRKIVITATALMAFGGIIESRYHLVGGLQAQREGGGLQLTML